MGKKAKKKLKSGSSQKEKKVASKTATSIRSTEAADAVTSAVVVSDNRVCPHVETGVNLENLSAKLKSLEHPNKCDDCREAGSRGSKGKGKKGGAESKAIWMCLECGHLSCGGVGLPNTPHTHAARHARLKHHQLAVKFENPQLRWCFSCDIPIRTRKSEDGVEEKDVLREVVKMMKVKPSDAAPVLDAEDIWFGRGSILSGVTLENSPAVGPSVKGGYSVKGLSNLGNTCFFNSVMQNLLALSTFREYFCNLDGSFGPLSTALKKLVSEVDTEYGMRNVVNPKSFFGSVCAKAPQFKGYQQQDSHELLRCMLDGLSTEELRARKLDGSWQQDGKSNPVFVDAMFGGQLSSTVTCLDCKHSSLVYEPFLDLSLPVPTKKPTFRKTQETARPRKPKPPSKRFLRPRPKISRDSNTSLSTSATRLSSGAVQSSVNGPEQNVISSGDVVCSDAETVANGQSLVTDSLSFTQHAESSQTVDNVTTTTEDMCWLDVLDADTNEYSQMGPDLLDRDVLDADTNEYSQMGPELLDSYSPVGENAVPTQSGLECSGGNSSKQIDAANCSYEGAWLDEPEQVRSINNEATSLHANEILEINDYGVRDAVQSEVEGLEFHSVPSSQGCYYGPHFPEKYSEEETPLLVRDSEVGDAVQSEVEGLEFPSLPFSQDCNYGPHLPIKFSEEETSLLVQDSEVRDGVQSEVEGLEYHSLPFTQDCYFGPHLPEKFLEEETPLLVQDSEVLLLPYTEGIVTSSEMPKADIEFSSSVPDPESDSLGFDGGLGDLFNEPEVAGPSLNHLNIGFRGNTSDSEPDEVDDSNAPVSVESCLSFFTKAERLCKKEHAWQCENCSKVLQQKMCLKKKLRNSRSEHAFNRDADTATSGMSHSACSQGIMSDSSEARPLCNGSVKGEIAETFDDNSMSNGEKVEGKGNCKVENTVGNPAACNSADLKHGLDLAPACRLGSFAEDATSSALDNNCKNCEGCNVDEQRYDRFADGDVQELVAQTENLSLESDGEEDQMKNEKTVKVERDATKRILINRAPPILTIHLKRFSQDGRGCLSKLKGHVQFNHTIDLKPFMDKSCADKDDCKYRLVGLVEHSGSMRHGHYVAYVRGGTKNARGDDVWYYASDAHVREASLEEVLRAEAYILFYERV